MRLVAYIRVSRVAGREGDRFISPGEQRRGIEGWAAAQGHEIVAWIEDLDEPGTRHDRPGLLEAMNAAEDGIVVARLDRFGRSVPHLAALIEQLTARGAALFTVAEGINTAGPTGRMLATILSAIAEFDLERIRANWFAARSAAVRRGLFVGGTVPMGYERTQAGRLVLGADADVVREAFARRAGGESWASLARSLERSVGAVRHMIANRTYLGEVRGGQGLVNTQAHDGLVDRATFEAANRVRGIAPVRSEREGGLLSGILRCAGCRYAMKPVQNASRHGKPGREYRCKAARRENAAPCPAPAYISASVIEPFVVEAFLAGIGGYEARAVADTDALAEAAQALIEAEGELDAALDTRLAAIVDDERRLALVANRQAAVDRAEEALAEARASQGSAAKLGFAKLWPDLDLVERRQLLASALDAVFVRRGSDVSERTHICWRGEGPELPTRGRRWAPRSFDFPP